jgi:hypothetical protein
MPYGTGRLCSCNNDFCLKSPLCDYNTLLNPYDSSSGIDKNQFERKEDFRGLNKRENHNSINITQIIVIITTILLLYFLFFHKKNQNVE